MQLSLKYYRYFIVMTLVLLMPFISYCNRVNAYSNLPENTKFDCQELNDSGLAISPATCNASDGKITGMSGKGTGVLKYTWFNHANQIVGEEADLINVPAGLYHVRLKDDSKCLAVLSKEYLVPDKDAVVIDDSKTVITTASCNNDDGSVTGIIIKNADQFTWTNTKGAIVSQLQDLQKAPVGTYILTATGTTGCQAQSTYKIEPDSYFPPIVKIDTLYPKCNSTGSLIITFDVKETDQIYNYALVNDEDASHNVQSGVIAYSSANAINVQITIGGILPPNHYTLYISNENACRITLPVYLDATAFEIDDSKVVIHNDYCGQSIGAIVGLKVKGLTGVSPGPYSWRNEAGKFLSGTAFLGGVPAGNYTLTVTDPLGCITAKQFTIRDSTNLALPPKIGDDIKLCLAGAATIQVIDPVANDTYNLYDSTETFVTSNKFGTFPLNVPHTSVYYVTHIFSTCESIKIPVTISVATPGVFIPNTFTPNNDGTNDYWKITGLENFPGAKISVFDRYGTNVYDAVNYALPFDGRHRGRALPAGVYYYVIDVKKPACMGKISGSLTILR